MTAKSVRLNESSVGTASMPVAPSTLRGDRMTAELDDIPPTPPSSSHYVRSNKPPIYTSDKRAKFTQRENKQWVRLVTVIGYLVSVCLPAVALSIYYVGFWEPKYPGLVNRTAATLTNVSSPLFPIYSAPSTNSSSSPASKRGQSRQKTPLGNLPIDQRSDGVSQSTGCPVCKCDARDRRERSLEKEDPPSLYNLHSNHVAPEQSDSE